MKKLYIPVLVLLAVFALMNFNLENAFVNASPILVDDEAIKERIIANIDTLDIDNGDLQDVINVFGEPESYIWEGIPLTKEELKGFYIMFYSDFFQVWMAGDEIVELRIYDDFYTLDNGLTIGSTLEEVLNVLPEPSEIVQGGPSDWKDEVLYKDLNDTIGFCYYSLPDLNLRLFCRDYIVDAVYITRSDKPNFVNEFEEKVQKNVKYPALTRVNTDDIDLPFVDDQKVIGSWKSVDFVKEIEDFEPDSKFWKGDLHLEGLTFKENGMFDESWLTWTNGYVMHSGDKTAAQYIIQEIDGSKYMFYEWKSGDYVFRNQKPYYYVLKKED